MPNPISTYNENRLAMLIAVSGPSGTVISTQLNDVSNGNAVGICIDPCETYLFSWQTHGELCWQIWYAMCSSAIITVWEWFGSPVLGGPILTPGSTIYNPITIQQTPIVGTIKQPTKQLSTCACSSLRKMIEKKRAELTKGDAYGRNLNERSGSNNTGNGWTNFVR